MLKLIKIDQRKLMPLDHQIAYQLQSLILTRKIPDRALLPAFKHFAQTFPIDETAFHAILRHLLDQKLIERSEADYRVVAPIIPAQAVDELRGLFSAIKAIGLEPSVQELGIEAMPFPNFKFVNQSIDFDDVWLLKRLYLGSNQPIAIFNAYLPRTLYPNLDRHELNGQAIYPFLAEHFGVQVLSSPRSLSGKALNAQEATLLNYPEGAAALKVNALSTDTQGRLMEFVDLCILADYLSFQEKID